MDVLKTAILRYITTAEKGETLKDVGEYLLLIASLLVCIVMACSCMLILKSSSSKSFDFLNEILRYNMQMVYDLQLKAGVEVGMAALWFIHNENFLHCRRTTNLKVINLLILFCRVYL